ncbi:MAG: hypothetical protein A2580_16935 [Hydrogenophilales bacterium RIFOXYD1_FULL_62_11]|nr:MAG: hypothetical protein A2580_16935 [Hydrogenophilales bacterium RIFOXYD1_FULL_62_11]
MGREEEGDNLPTFVQPKNNPRAGFLRLIYIEGICFVYGGAMRRLIYALQLPLSSPPQPTTEAP